MATRVRSVIGTTVMVVLAVGGMVWLLEVGTRPGRLRTACKANLKQIAQALHQYHDAYGSFPPAYVLGEDGQRWHSWRVLVLPQLGHDHLYQQYHFDEPWNGPRNRLLLDKMPSVFRCPVVKSKELTNYVAVVGPQTVWPEQYACKISDLIDGADDTIQLVEHPKSDIAWLEPRDLTFAQTKKQLPATPAECSHGEWFHVALPNGSVKSVSAQLHHEIWRTLLTRNQGGFFPGVEWPLQQFQFAADEGATVPHSSLTRTDMPPHVTAQISPERNLVYCATFQIAWDGMRNEIIKAPIDLEGSPEMAVELNRVQFDKANLDDASYVALAGPVKDGIFDRIDQEMNRKFPGKQRQLGKPSRDDVFWAYCYLFKRLPFATKFDKLDQPLPFQTSSGPVLVEAFGIHGGPQAEMMRGQVEVLDYVTDDDFVLRLKTPTDDIVLAKIAPLATLAEMIDAVKQRRLPGTGRRRSENLQPLEPLIIPRLSANIDREFSELVVRHLVNPGWAGFYIAGARQIVKFQLDESGAILESEADVTFNEFDEPKIPLPQPRRFIFDKPFLVILQQRNATQPYFAAWIANEELLSPVSGSAK
ncbi:MAG: DUF1559 domain-containing protein [Planctomycetaceae bacterium]|nr:DUF1559 domain-containing protein [Planctomycetaceae bacterium]